MRTWAVAMLVIAAMVGVSGCRGQDETEALQHLTQQLNTKLAQIDGIEVRDMVWRKAGISETVVGTVIVDDADPTNLRRIVSEIDAAIASLKDQPVANRGGGIRIFINDVNGRRLGLTTDFGGSYRY